MSTRDWTPTDRELPPEGVVVETMNSAGEVTDLVYESRLWFYADRSMYVYYVPKFWRFAS